MELYFGIITLTVIYVQICNGVHWDQIHCQLDLDEKIPDGIVPKEEIGRFPWIGIIQHDFFLANKMRYAVTAGVLIHPAYVLAPAEDMAKINRQTITVLLRLPRACSASGMFADAHVDGFHATVRLRAAATRRRLCGSTNSILRVIADRIDSRYCQHWSSLHCSLVKNSTRFILWSSDNTKHTIRVEDYVMHHEYELEKTYATIALVEIMPDGLTTRGHPSVVFPICLPYKGVGTYENLYVIRMTDTTGELMKEVTKVNYVEKEDCDSFYEKSELDYPLMVPTESICVTAHAQQPACVWDGGSVLVSRKADSWTLLGFGTHGPGCGAPARFVNVNSHMEWIDIQITAIPVERSGDDTGYILRSLSPVEIVMYNPGEHSKTMEGQCKTSKSTSVVYRDSSEVLITNNYGRGYFFLALSDQADFSCLLVNLHCNMRSNAVMWVEHNCYRDVSSTHRGQDKKRLQCYKYFKSTAFIEFRFTFSYLAKIEVKVFGSRATEPSPPLDPWAGEMTTLTWWPTDGERHGLRWGLFVPVDAWWHWL